ncbi:MAG: PilZ domain-containing protein [Acidobacteriota bacterium]
MDKRAAVRVPVRVRVQCRTHGLVIDGLVEDVSRSGLFMRAPRSVIPGSSAEVAIDLPGQETLHLAAEVVRIDEPRSGMGLRFVGDSDHKRRPLANFIMRQHATSR